MGRFSKLEGFKASNLDMCIQTEVVTYCFSNEAISHLTCVWQYWVS